MNTDKQSTDGTIFEFLHGSHSFGGVWFGEPHPILTGNFWWRKFLPTQQPKADTVTAWVERKIEIYGEPKKTDYYIYKDKWGSFGECVYAYPPSTINESWCAKQPVSWLEQVQLPIQGYSLDGLENKKDLAIEEYSFQVPYDGTKNFYNEDKAKHFSAGWDAAIQSLKQQEG